MIRIPEPPAAADTVSAPILLRYEDVSEDGRIVLQGLPHALGDVTWPAMMVHPDAGAIAAAGIVPILVRMVLEGTEVCVPATRPLRGEGAIARWTARSPDGAVDRIVLSMWVSLFGRPGTTWGGSDPSAEEALVGRVYAEHVFTRPFAPVGQRRVVALPSGVPEALGTLRPFAGVGGHGEPLPDTEIVFGAHHTDSNQHVNSLVYPRRFEDIAVDGEPKRPLARRCEVVWRKPFFAGDRAILRRWTVAPGVQGGAFVDGEGIERCRIALV